MSNVDQVFQDKEFMDKVLQMTPEDAVVAFQERGVDCTVQDLMKAKELLQQCVNEDGSISEDALENVAGGGAVGDFFKGLGKGLLYGTVAVGVGAAIALGW